MNHETHTVFMSIFRWSEVGEWESTVRSLMGNLLDDEILNAFRDSPPRYLFGGDLSWLQRIIKKVHRIDIPNLHDILSVQLKRHYHSIVAFHGCRPVSVIDYQTHGVQPSNPENLQKTAFELFGDSDVVKKWVSELAAPEHGLSYEEYNAGRVFLVLSYEHLVESCGHYLLYGSEYLLSIANAVGMAQRLRDRGRATVIECVVPASVLSHSFYHDLSGCIIEEMFGRVLEPDLHTLDLHFSFSVRCVIPPANIFRFHHPTMIPNPHNRMIRES